jgi:hypothetical protein
VWIGSLPGLKRETWGTRLLKQVDAALASAGKLVWAGKFTEAIQFLEAQPAAVRRSVRVQTAEAGVKEEQQQAAFRMIGRAYTVLETELPAGESTMRWVVSALGDSTFAGPVAEAFHARMQAFADRAILDLISKCKIMLANHERAGAGELFKQASGIIDYAGVRTKSDWQSFVNQTTKTGLITRQRSSQL